MYTQSIDVRDKFWSFLKNVLFLDEYGVQGLRIRDIKDWGLLHRRMDMISQFAQRHMRHGTYAEKSIELDNWTIVTSDMGLEVGSVARKKLWQVTWKLIRRPHERPVRLAIVCYSPAQ